MQPPWYLLSSLSLALKPEVQIARSLPEITNPTQNFAHIQFVDSRGIEPLFVQCECTVLPLYYEPIDAIDVYPGNRRSRYLPSQAYPASGDSQISLRAHRCYRCLYLLKTYFTSRSSPSILANDLPTNNLCNVYGYSTRKLSQT